MSDRAPIMWLSKMNGTVEGDCACPDSERAFPGASWVCLQDMHPSDCACPHPAQSKPAQTVDYPGPWRRPPDLYRGKLPNNHEVVFTPALTGDIAVLNAPARRVLDAFAEPRELPQAVTLLSDMARQDVSRMVVDMATHGLLHPVDQSAVVCQTAPRTLTAWLHVTGRCNLRCTYCYLSCGQEDMEATTGRAAIRSLFDSAIRHGFRAVKLKYAGGEPSLNFDLVRTLHEYAQSLADRYRLDLRAALLSNGVALHDDDLRILRQMDIRLALSLDGIGPVHDAQRGRGTFASVNQTLERAIALGLAPHVSATVTAQSAAGLQALVAYLLDRDLAFNLNFYRETNRCSTPGALGAHNEQLIAGMRSALAVIEGRLPQRSLVGGMLDRASLGVPHNYPCGVGRSYVVIDSLGRISRCHMVMDQIVGSVEVDDPVEAIAAGDLHNPNVDDKEGCAGCTWRYWCAGGCPLLARRLKGREDVASPYCEVYRAIFPELLRLEGMRLLKHGPQVA